MIYLEPRTTFDAAIVESDPLVIYDYELLIQCICDEINCDYLEAVDYYCYNIEYLLSYGLEIINDD